ncbi:YbaB/EbfC family nucleoid-associated protein [Actinoplanes sp. CA-252034]|uniref:YbaB/EbfC family nucleoid-associated protein n=1 Tax=Actinoplanes sp. CA-252034 TaxID=3239906 RepID=UPI003D9612F5
MSDFDLAGRLRTVAEEMSALSDDLRAATTAAHAREFHAADHDGYVEVTVDGRPRVISIRLHRDAFQLHPDDLDEMLTPLLNDVLGQARTAVRDAIFEALPPHLRTDIERAADR